MTDPEPSRRNRNWGRWLLISSITTGIGCFFAFGPDEQTIIRKSAEWREATRSDLFAALLLFFLAEVVLLGLSIPIGIWLTVLAGFLFGVWVGTAVVNVGATVGAFLAFLSSRYGLAGTIHRWANTRPHLARGLAAIDKGFQDHGAYYVLLLRLTPVLPFWMMNLGLGLTKVRLRDYWWATQLGMLPATLVVANAGASLAEITSFREVLSWRVLVALCLLPLVPFVLHQVAGRWVDRSEGKQG